MTALAVRATGRRGRHRLTLKRRLIRCRNARRSAFTLGGVSSVPAYSGDGHYFPAFLTAVALALTGLILLVVFW